MNRQPTIFEFISYKLDLENQKIFFNYKQEFKTEAPIFYTETLILPKIANFQRIDQELLHKILQGIHLILGVSYYKLYCATKVKLNYSLTKEESHFWNTIYRNGLGEFYYRNQLNPKNAPKFSFDKKLKPHNYRLERNNKCLVGVSGGKDSIVVAELLKEQEIDITAFFVEINNNSVLVDKVVEELNIDFSKIQRILDPQVLEKHKYNGHIPISAIYAFLGILDAILFNYSYFIVANEYSSNFGNIKYKGQDINHQWSKSYEFEFLFSEYLNNSISPDIKYFSLLRPFYEIRIAEMFSKYKKYFPIFSSCNKNFKIVEKNKSNLWCGECPKCIFAFILFSAFLTKEELLNIFKKNLYQEEQLLPLFKDVLGLGKMKPFDCVGTFEESKVAFYLGNKKFQNDFIVKTLLPKIKIKQKDIENLFRAQNSLNIPSQFKFFGIKNILILGFGKEGIASKKYIEKFYPNLKIGIADKNNGKNYLKEQKEYDFSIKTPGIQKELVKIPYTTATNIFFSRIKELGNKTIGITGSKGKSTTASLIYSILKEAGKNVKISGNIGSPMLESLLYPIEIEKDEIFVLELSSYQLDDIEFSPDIAVITNLFPEHMNYHQGIENYYKAKINILNFQTKESILVYNPKNKNILKFAKGRTIPFAEDDFIDEIKLSLIGEHNKENIKAAITVARQFRISEEIIKSAIEKFKSLPHRLEYVGEFNGIKFYDDAISTTPESTIAAIKSLKNVDTIFLGGEDRGYNFSQLEKIIRQYKIKNIVLFPDSGKRMLKSKKGLNILETKSMQKAVEFAFKNTEKGSICLLSCASPSYSVWKNFEEKGDQFQLFIKKNK